MKTPLFILLAVFLGISTFAQNSAELKLNPEKNKVYKLKSVTEQNILINNGQQTTSVKNVSYVSLKAMDITPTFVVAEIRFDTIISSIQAPGMNMNINSKNPGDIKSGDISAIMSAFMNRLSKAPVFAKLNPNGTVLEIINQKMLSDIMLKDVDSIKGQMGEMIKPRLKSMVELKTLKTMVESVTANLPGKSVAVGDTWLVDLLVSSDGMGFLVKNTFKLNGINGNTADISTESTIDPASTEPMEMGGVKISYDLRGTGKGTVSLNTQTGLIKKSSATQSMQGTMSVQMQGNNMQMPTQIQSAVEVTELP